jgi:hypothetical protein
MMQRATVLNFCGCASFDVEIEKCYGSRSVLIDIAGRSVIFLPSYGDRLSRFREVLVFKIISTFVGEGDLVFHFMLLAD